MRGIKRGDIVVGEFQHQSINVLDSTRFCYKSLLKVSPKELAFLHLAIIAYQGVKCLSLAPRSSVVVMGQGIIGRLAKLICSALGHQTVVIVRTEEKKRLLRGESCFTAADLQTDNMILGPDAIVDSTGDPTAIKSAVELSKIGGVISLLGSNRGLTKDFPIGICATKKLKVIGSHIFGSINEKVGNQQYKEDARFLEELLAEKKLSFSSLLSVELEASQAACFYSEKLKEKRDMFGCLINWHEQTQRRKITQAKLQENFSEEAVVGQKKLRIGIVGCGDIFETNFNAISQSGVFEVCAALEVNKYRAAEIRGKFKIPVFENIGNFLNATKIDVALISAPNFLHKEIGLKCLNAGLHVLMEKPLAINKDDALTLIAGAREKSLAISTFYSYRYRPEFRILRELYDKGALGKFQSSNIIANYYRKPSYWFGGSSKYDLNWRAMKNRSGGGVLLMNLIHYLDLFENIFDFLPQESGSTFGYQNKQIDIEDSVMVHYKTVAGETLNLSGSTIGRGSSGDFRGKQNEYINVYGNCGQVIIQNGEVTFYSTKSFSKYTAQKWHTFKPSQIKNFRSEFLRNFYSKILSKEYLSYSDTGLGSLSSCLQAYQEGENQHETRRIPA